MNFSEDMFDDNTPFVEDVIIYSSVCTDDVAAVQVRTRVDGALFCGEGSAKRHPKDKPDHEIGILLASSRALRDLAKQMESSANRQVALKDLRAKRKKKEQKSAEGLFSYGKYHLVYVDQSGSVVNDPDLNARMLAAARRVIALGGTLMGFSAEVFPYNDRDTNLRGGVTNLEACIKHARGRRALIITDGLDINVDKPENVNIIHISPTRSPLVESGIEQAERGELHDLRVGGHSEYTSLLDEYRSDPIEADLRSQREKPKKFTRMFAGGRKKSIR